MWCCSIEIEVVYAQFLSLFPPWFKKWAFYPSIVVWDPADRQKLFGKEMSKVSQLEEGKGAEKRGIISRTGEKPPAAAEIEMGQSGVFTGKGIWLGSKKKDNFNSNIWNRRKIKRHGEGNCRDFESKIFVPLDCREAVTLTYANRLPEDLIENEAKIGSAYYFVQLSYFSSKLKSGLYSHSSSYYKRAGGCGLEGLWRRFPVVGASEGKEDNPWTTTHRNTSL